MNDLKLPHGGPPETIPEQTRAFLSATKRLQDIAFYEKWAVAILRFPEETAAFARAATALTENQNFDMALAEKILYHPEEVLDFAGTVAALRGNGIDLPVMETLLKDAFA
jgi:hypothetical protein